VARESAANYRQGKSNITLFTAPHVDLACNASLVGLALRAGSKLGGKNAHL
jgi:hypothetical protein